RTASSGGASSSSRGLLKPLERQRQRERCTRVGSRQHVERAAVRLGDRARDEEPETRAGLRGAGYLGTPELLEDHALLLVRDARPVVAHGDPDRPGLAACGNL